MATDDVILSELQDDVPSLANQAATELDNLILGRGENVSAIQQFVRLLKDELSNNGADGTRRMPVKATTFVVMNRAVKESDPDDPASTVREVVALIGHYTESLEKVVADPHGFKESKPEEMGRLRSFCLAYSRSASASQRPRDGRPKNPFRK